MTVHETIALTLQLWRNLDQQEIKLFNRLQHPRQKSISFPAHTTPNATNILGIVHQIAGAAASEGERHTAEPLILGSSAAGQVRLNPTGIIF